MKRILIVEPDVSLCLSLSNMLGEFGFDTAVADTSTRALRILGECIPLPDVILLNLNRSNRDGLALRGQLANHKKYCNIPVVSMSDDSNISDIMKKLAS